MSLETIETLAPAALLENTYRPHEGQRHVHDSAAKEKWLEAGRRWGKGRCAFGEMLRAYQQSLQISIEEINRYSQVPPGFHAWIVVPSYPQGRQAWNELLQLLPQRFRRDQPDRRAQILYLNGQSPEIWGQIELKSAVDPDSLQTVGLDFLWVSEAQDVAEEAVNKLRPTLRQPGRLGRAIYEGIPALWPDHWFWRGCGAADRGEIAGHEFFHYTAFENPLMTDAMQTAIEGDRALMPENAWRRMYLAERSASAGFFKNVDACISGDLLKEPVPGASYVAGLDIGTTRDFTVLMVLDADTRTVVFHQFWDSTPWPDVRAQITAHCRSWNVQRLFPDATGFGKNFSAELINDGLPVEGGTDGLGINIIGETRTNLLGDLVVALERETLHFPNIPLLIRQLRAFQYRRNERTNTVIAAAPPGEHDDEVFALALGLAACNPPAQDEGRGPIKRMRYMQTQDEAASGSFGQSEGIRMLRDLRHRRRQELYERMGYKR